MEHCPLGKLPPELRNQIYKIVFARVEPLPLTLSSAKTSNTRRPSVRIQRYTYARDAIALTSTCRQIRTESIPIFLSLNTFTINISASAIAIFKRKAGNMFENFLADFENASNGSLKAMRPIGIHLGHWPIEVSKLRTTFIGVAKGLRKVATKYGIRAVFSASFELGYFSTRHQTRRAEFEMELDGAETMDRVLKELRRNMTETEEEMEREIPGLDLEGMRERMGGYRGLLEDSIEKIWA